MTSPLLNLRARRPRRNRRGATMVETALVLPVFLLILFALLEFGHAYMTEEMLKAAARAAARTGVAEGKTTTDVVNKVKEMIGASMDANKATVYVKDGSTFDSANPEMPASYEDLPDVEVSALTDRQLFIVRVEIPYSQVSIIPTGWLKNATLSGQAVMRHE